MLLVDNQTATTAFALANDATIDLGGYTLAGAGLTVSAGDVVITNGTYNYSVSGVTVSGGKFTLAANTTMTGNYNAEPINITGTFDVYGTIVDQRADAYAIVTKIGATVNAYAGCSITAANAAFKPKADGGKSYINVYGGTFTTTSKDYYQGIFYGSKADTSEIMIADGTFNAGNDRTFAFKKDTYIIKGPNGVALDSSCTAKFSNDPTTDIGKADNVVAPTLATGYEFVKGDDDYYTIAKIPSFDVTFTKNTTEDLGSTNVLRGTALTADMIPAVSGGTWDVDPLNAVITSVTNFNYTVAVGPEWPEDDPDFPADADATVKEKFVDWATTYGVEDVAGKSDAFLMNVDPTGDVPELEIESIAVEGTTATITVGTDTDGFDLGTVNGVLYVESTDELAGEWTIEEYDLPTGDVGETATFTVKTGKFMRAKVGFKAPVVE